MHGAPKRLSGWRMLLASHLALIMPTAAVTAGEFTEYLRFDAQELVFVNVIGEVEIEQAAGSDFEIEIAVQGRDASREVIQVQSWQEREAKVVVTFPLDEERNFVYPRLGRKGKATIAIPGDLCEEGSWLARLLNSMSHKKVHVSGSGSGLEVWADATVRVPAGKRFVSELGIGKIGADNIAADLQLDIHSGPVTARNTGGALSADAGSGSVTVYAHEGELIVDTGSGAVSLERCRGDRIIVDTGSGSVRAEDITCRQVIVDTGSGPVSVKRLEADVGKFDTGSGEVFVQFQRVGSGDFVVDTGSGPIDLMLPQDVSATITAETSRGSIVTHLQSFEIREKGKHYLVLAIGEGGTRIRLETGSGSIHIHH